MGGNVRLTELSSTGHVRKHKRVHLETVWKLPSIWKKPAKQLPNLITISGGRREKSFRYNSEGQKNGKLIFLFFLQLKKRHLFSIRIFKNLLICVIVDFFPKEVILKCFLLKLVVLEEEKTLMDGNGRWKILGQRLIWNNSIAAKSFDSKALKFADNIFFE